MAKCGDPHPTLGYPCYFPPGHEGHHEDPFDNRWESVAPSPVVHQAVAGYPGGIDVQHRSGTCYWCDAERFRSLLRQGIVE